MDENEKSEALVGNKSDNIPNTSLIKPQAREPYDPTITFEEYTYYAKITREEEIGIEPPVLNIRQWFGKKSQEENREPTSTLDEQDFASRERRLEISDEEWTNASRAFRSASWGACKLRAKDHDAVNTKPRRFLLDYDGCSRSIRHWVYNGNPWMGPCESMKFYDSYFSAGLT